MEALKLLKNEHSTILRQVYEMDTQLGLLEGLLESLGPGRTEKILRRLLESTRRISDSLSLHTRKEEIALFPILAERLGTDGDLVEAVRREHLGLLRLLASLMSEIERMIEQPDTIKTWNLTAKLQELKGSMSDHILKEERVLFWLADLHLSVLDQRKIAFDLSDTGSVPVEAGPSSSFQVNKSAEHGPGSRS